MGIQRKNKECSHIILTACMSLTSVQHRQHCIQDDQQYDHNEANSEVEHQAARL